MNLTREQWLGIILFLLTAVFVAAALAGVVMWAVMSSSFQPLPQPAFTATQLETK